MKRLRLLIWCFPILFLLFQVRYGYGQSPKDSVNTNGFICITETQPQFPGGPKALREYLRQNVRYPEAAARKKVKGRVWVSFVIDTAGYISDPTILKELGYGCDEEAIRVVREMPVPWKPGTLMDKLWRVKYNLPISFPIK